MLTITLVETLKYFFILAGKLAVLFVVISFFVALMQEYVPSERIQKVLGGNRHPLINNAIGAGFGALTPFCTCSTIPITIGLLNARAPFGAVMSFLISSPLLNPVIISLFLVLLGIKITLIYVLIVFPTAVLTGFIWEKLGLASQVKDVVIERSCCSSQAGAVESEPEKYSRAINAFWSAWALFRQMFPWLLVGAGIGAAINGFVPQELIIKIAGPNNPLAIPIAALVGIPMYIRTETMLPISSVLLSKGMGIGAVMALIIGGSGASIPEVTLLAAIFKKKLVITFLVTVLIIAVLSGIVFSLLV